jgi:hypothetical protein
MYDLEDLTLRHLRQLKREKEAYADIWAGCHDGSYEAALGNCGYYEVMHELNKRGENE